MSIVDKINGSNGTANHILQVGDVIYSKGYNNTITGKYVIDKVTKTQAISGNIKFKREVTWRVFKVGENLYTSTSYHLETPVLKDQYNRSTAIDFIKSTDYTKYSLDHLERIVKAILGTESK